MTARRLQADFAAWSDLDAIPHPWSPKLVGSGRARLTGAGLRLATSDASPHAYSNAQLDDYQGVPRRGFPWSPPLVLTVQARFSHEAMVGPSGLGLLGTAGFGFWNDPFMMTGTRPPTLPRALWFFYASPPSDMPLALDVPGCGWKAAMLDALRPSVAPWLLVSPLAVALMNAQPLYRRLWPRIQAALHICEARIQAPMTDWHTYHIEWGIGRTRFAVDGQTLLLCDVSPLGPLGLVIWKDNQYLVATPWGHLRYGCLAIPGEQWLEIATVEITPTIEEPNARRRR
jgi:hypothetical protein